MAVRAAVAVIAVLVIGWSAVLLRDTRQQERGTALAETSRDPATLERAVRHYEAASFLNPDTGPEVGRALALQSQGRAPEARAALEDVVRREPDNLTGWRLLAAITKELDPARSRQAVERARELDPLGTP
jgi:predicted Zn-dependent protease